MCDIFAVHGLCSTFIVTRPLKSQKNNRVFASFAQAVLFALWERSSSIFRLPVLPLSHLHTSEPYCTLHKLKLHMHSHTGKNTAHTPVCTSHSSHSLSVSCAHTHTYGCVSQAVEIGQLAEVLLSVLVVLQNRSVKHFLLSLMFLLRRALINILYGFYMDLFSFLLLSPRGAMATFSCLFNDCGWTINNLHTSKHSTTPTWCWRFNFKGEAKDIFSLKGTWKSCRLGS